MAFKDVSSKLNFKYWFEPEFLGEQWGLGVHDLDGNGYLDFYANHHGQKTGEIIMNFGSASPTNIDYEIGGDTHGVTFFDIDQDGDKDLLQAQGGQRGLATDAANKGLFNKILLNDDGVLSRTNSVEAFGLEYALGRKRLITPVNFDGELAVYVGVLNDRPDGLYPGQFYRREDDGAYEAFSPVGPSVSGEIAKGVHFGDDRFVDVINLDHKQRALRVFENEGAGFDGTKLDTSGNQILDVVTGDFDGDLESEILVGRAGRRDGLFRKNASGDWVDEGATSTAPFTKSSRAIGLGDFDNDGDLDYAALKAFRGQPGVEVHTYLNRGDGTFKLGSVFSDPEIVGQSEFMIAGDFNRDGALDLLITNSYPRNGGEGSRDGEYTWLEGVPTRNNWLSVELRGTGSETGGLGARVYVTTPDGKVRVLEQDGKAHFTSHDSTDLHFGLGAARRADVRIVWPDGREQEVENVSANRHVVLRESLFANSVTGTSGVDALEGSGAADLLRGRADRDALHARRGDDALFGGGGRDRLFGGAGEDALSGGRGRDSMVGGGGDDVFAFVREADARLGRRRDGIEDFAPGEDVLDLSGLEPDSARGAFDFIGAERFGGEAGELRYAGEVVAGDTDGDGAADFEIELPGDLELGARDLLL